jgi:hypothetical protein
MFHLIVFIVSIIIVIIITIIIIVVVVVIVVVFFFHFMTSIFTRFHILLHIAQVKNGSEPEFTNWAGSDSPFVETLDYVFLSPHWKVQYSPRAEMHNDAMK